MPPFGVLRPRESAIPAQGLRPRSRPAPVPATVALKQLRHMKAIIPTANSGEDESGIVVVSSIEVELFDVI